MSEWIPLLVRAEDYQELAAMVVTREAGRDGDQTVVMNDRPTDPAEPAPNPAEQLLSEYPAWPKTALLKLSTLDSATAQRWTKALDAISADEDQVWFTTSEVAERTGMAINEWRDAPRKIHRHIKAHLPDVPARKDGPSWPLVGHSFDGSEVSWAVTAGTRACWREIRGL